LTPKKPKDSSLIIRVTLELAHDIFSESGDLPSTSFPALMILAEAIGKALPLPDEDAKKRPTPTIITKTREPKPAHNRTPFEFALLTR
jgi:hypothetical protein